MFEDVFPLTLNLLKYTVILNRFLKTLKVCLPKGLKFLSNWFLVVRYSLSFCLCALQINRVSSKYIENK